MKKILVKVRKIIGCMLVVLLVGLIGIYLWHQCALQKEKREYTNAYGQMVNVNGKKICVEISGEGEQVIVLLPGFNAASPVLEMKGLTSALKEKYKVIVVEPLGYGLSDAADTPRTVENIATELHEVLSQLGYKQYILMGHSLSGIYSLYYASHYAEEVIAYVGIDSSVPAQLMSEEKEGDLKSYQFLSKLNKAGIYRLLAKLDAEGVVPTITDYPFTKKEKALYEALVYRNFLDQTLLDEYKHTEDNFQKTMHLKFPSSVPVLYLLATSSCREDPKWQTLHEALLTSNSQSELVVLDGDHYLHETHGRQIASLVDDWLQKNK